MRKIVVLSAVSAGIDALTELRRLGVSPQAIVGLASGARGRGDASGWVDVAQIAGQLGVPAVLAASYRLDDPCDRLAIEALRPDVIIVLGWQRLVPDWLIALPPEGVLGSHGSFDGIAGGRGRSPQNWAIMLGAPEFELALFRITPGVDDGPVIATRKFVYGPQDDIAVSYQRATLSLAEMLAETLARPTLPPGRAQDGVIAYLPQRKPEDGIVDWSLPGAKIAAHCRALARPYPGLQTSTDGQSVTIWRCQPFDSARGLAPGEIGPCFEAGDFLVGCGDGRLLIREWSCENSDWQPRPATVMASQPWSHTLAAIVTRHQTHHPDRPVNARILAELKHAQRSA